MQLLKLLYVHWTLCVLYKGLARDMCELVILLVILKPTNFREYQILTLDGLNPFCDNQTQQKAGIISVMFDKSL